MFNKTAQKVLSVALTVALAVTPYSTAFATTTSGKVDQKEATPSAAALTEAENVVNSTVAGVGRSQAAGVYTAKSINGAAIRTPKANLAGALGLGKGETAWVSTWDVTQKKSPAAAASLQAAAASIGGACGPMFAFNVNKMSGGKLTPATGEVEAAFGIPANFRGYANYSIARVIAGGEMHIYRDKDSNPNTITVDLPAGNSACAIVGNN